MSRVYWDTMLFVYLFEKDPAHAAEVRRVLDRMFARQDVLCTSVFTVGEVLVGPCKRKAVKAQQSVKEAFAQPWIRLLSFTPSTAEIYAELRADLNVSAPDAIHLACAAESGIDLFLTNDRALEGKHVAGIQFIARYDSGVI